MRRRSNAGKLSGKTSPCQRTCGGGTREQPKEESGKISLKNLRGEMLVPEQTKEGVVKKDT